MKIKTMVINALVAALYIVLTILVKPYAYKAIQFRIPEMFNHLIVFNKKYLYGIVGGVFIANLLFSEMGVLDLVFGLGHTVLALLSTLIVTKKTTNIWVKMTINTLFFAFFSFLIAWELEIVLKLSFWFSYFTVALGELAVMGLSIPIMVMLDRSVHFKKVIEK